MSEDDKLKIAHLHLERLDEPKTGVSLAEVTMGEIINFVYESSSEKSDSPSKKKLPSH